MPGAPRLLLDQYLAPALVRRLADLFPGAAHVRELGLAAADDAIIRSRAASEGWTIVTKDDDFRQRSFLYGAPPKVVWIRLGNCATDDIERPLRTRALQVLTFVDDPRAALLVLGQRR